MSDEHDPHSGDPYEVLGVPDDATMEEIRAAFKKLAQKYHPDRNPEPEAEAAFKQVVWAENLLTNKEKRAYFDKYGKEKKEEELTNAALRSLSSIVIDALDRLSESDVEYKDLVGIVRGDVKTGLSNMRSANLATLRQLDKRKRALKRVKRKKGKGKNMLAMFIHQDLKSRRAELASQEQAIKVMEKVLTILDDYGYEVLDPYTESFGKGIVIR